MRRLSAILIALAFGCGSESQGGGECAGEKCDDLGSADASQDTGDAGAACVNNFPAAWSRGGPDCGTEPDIQIHRFDRDTFILRQSLCTSFEAPFLFLLFGADTVLLEDTGAGGIDVADAVFQIIAQVLEERGQSSIDLVVVNSHGHGDHVAGNGQFEGRERTKVVGFTVPELVDFFAFSPWPDDPQTFDLGGGRVLDVLPIPGHEGADIAIFDRQTGMLLTGDTVYPGRLFIRDFPAYQASIDRLIGFASDAPLCWIVGTHIEMSKTPGDDYELDATFHPDEHALELGFEHLLELRDALAGMEDQPVQEVHDDFVVFPL